MELKEFVKYLPILQQGPFELYPDTKGTDPRGGSNRFIYIDHDQTHVKIQNLNTQTEYYLSLSLIELINPGRPGIIVLYREVRARNGSFV